MSAAKKGATKVAKAKVAKKSHSRGRRRLRRRGYMTPAERRSYAIRERQVDMREVWRHALEASLMAGASIDVATGAAAEAVVAYANRFDVASFLVGAE